jgi:hypothetical protein
MTFSVGATNGYNFLGASSVVVLTPGQQLLFYHESDAGAIGSSAKTIDVAGTGSQEFVIGVAAGS